MMTPEDKLTAFRFLAEQRPVKRFVTETSLQFAPDDVEAVKFGPFAYDRTEDEVRLLYWLGNSNLYWPLSLKKWRRLKEELK